MQKTRFGLEPRHLEILERIFSNHLSPGQVLLVWIFGSRATGKNRPFSDIDLLLEATPPIDFSTQAKLAHELEESNLPFKVDLIPLEQLYLPYAQQIQSEKKLLFKF